MRASIPISLLPGTQRQQAVVANVLYLKILPLRVSSSQYCTDSPLPSRNSLAVASFGKFMPGFAQKALAKPSLR